MPLLADYAITPDVFDTTSYSTEEVCALHLGIVGEVMRSEGLVRDLRAGAWRALFAGDERPWHLRAKELVKSLAKQSRLIAVPGELPDVPIGDQGWCQEALATHASSPLTGGVIVTQPIKDAYRYDTLVASIDRLDRGPWWRNRSESTRLTRTIAAYQQNLDVILRHANSLCFIDPYLDPTKTRYAGFADLLVAAGRRALAPQIEIHRKIGPGHSPRVVQQLNLDFRGTLTTKLQQAGLRAKVFVWDDFHDRYLISNLVGISLPNGFDTSNDPTEETTWARLGSRERDDIQREFDPASNRHTLHGKFTIP